MTSQAAATPPADSVREKGRGRGLGRRRWLALGGLTLGAYLAVSRLPYLFAPDAAQGMVTGTPPSAGVLLAIGLAVTLLSAGIVYVAIGTGGSFPKLVIALVIGYNALIVLVKFVLGPPAIWRETYIASFLNYDTPTSAQILASAASNAALSAGLEAVGLFLLYAAALTILFLSYRVRTRALLRRLVQGRPARRFLAVPLAALFIFAGSLLFVGLFVAPGLSGNAYVRDVFSSGTGVLAAVMLAAAITAAAGALQLASERAVLIRNASALTALFWLGIALLAVYHVLWVVYILTLLAMWPVKFTLLYHGK
jgi:hypothetical protein